MADFRICKISRWADKPIFEDGEDFVYKAIYGDSMHNSVEIISKIELSVENKDHKENIVKAILDFAGHEYTDKIDFSRMILQNFVVKK